MSQALLQRPWARRLLIEAPWCHYCSAEVSITPIGAQRRATLDHIVAKAHGGTNAMVNLVLACFRCNQLKSDRLACWCDTCCTAIAYCATHRLETITRSDRD